MAVSRMLAQWLPMVNRARSPVLKADLFQFYLFITDLQNTNEMQFGKMLTSRGFAIRASDRVRVDGNRRSGLFIHWKASDEMLRELEDIVGEKQPHVIVPSFTPHMRENNGHPK